jgi:hypothetical protein
VSSSQITHKRSVLELGLVGLAVAMLLARLLRLDLAPFVLDEPQFLAAAREQLHSGHWLSASPLVGNNAVHYGAAFVWFLSGVQAIAGPRPLAAIAAICVLSIVAHLFLASAITRLFVGGRLLFALLLGLLAASPYQFVWSRMAWDQPFLGAWVAIAVACLATRGPLRNERALLLGAALGLALSTHLMAAPLALAAFGVLGFDALRFRARGVRPLVIAAIACGVIFAPYALYYLHQHPAPTPLTGVHSSFNDFALGTIRVSTANGFEYYFDDNWSDFLSWLGAPSAVSALSSIGFWLVLAITALGLGFELVRGGPEERRLVVPAIFLWPGYALLYASRHLDAHPHYQTVTYWVVLVGIAGALRFFRSRRPLAIATGAVLALLVLVQAGFIAAAMRYLDVRGGTTGKHYSIPVREQARWLEQACTLPGRLLWISDEVLIFPQSLEYLASIEPRCEGKRLLFCYPGGCPKNGSVAILRYAHFPGGALTSPR